MSEATEILPEDTAGSLSDRLATLGAHLLIRTLDGLFEGTLESRPQPESPTPYARKIKKHHGRIDWTQPAEQLARIVRAMTPWPSAFTFVARRRLIVLGASSGDAAGEPGTVLSLSPLTVACGEGSLILHRVKPEGGKPMSTEAFLAGHSLEAGARVGDEPSD